VGRAGTVQPGNPGRVPIIAQFPRALNCTAQNSI
jgi:hypothetical protein